MSAEGCSQFPMAGCGWVPPPAAGTARPLPRPCPGAKPSSAGAPLHVLPSFQPGSVATFGPGPCHGFLGSQQLAPMGLQGQARHPLPSSFPGAQALLLALGAVALPALPQAPHVPLSCSGPAPSKDAAFPAFGTNTGFGLSGWLLIFKAVLSSVEGCPCHSLVQCGQRGEAWSPSLAHEMSPLLGCLSGHLAKPSGESLSPSDVCLAHPSSKPPFPAHLQGLGSSVGGMSLRPSAVLGLCCCLAPHITTRWMAAPLGWPPKSQQGHLSSFKCS